MNKVLLLSVMGVLLLAVGHFDALADDGVYVSGPSAKQQDVEALMKEFVRVEVINSLLQDTGVIVERIVRNQNVQIYPQMAGLAVQQIVQQVFKQEETMNICKDAYDDSFELIKVQRLEGLSQNQLQENARKNIKEIVGPIYDLPVYKNIVEKILEHTLKEQYRLSVLQVAQRQAQMMILQQQMNQMQQAVMKTYLENMFQGAQ